MSKLIMLVENSPAIRKIFSFMLTEGGHRTIEAENGADALEKLEKKRPDMIFTDLNMPVMDGVELIRKLRAKEPFKSLPVVVVTTEPRTSPKKEAAKAAGATAWLTKPFTPEQVFDIVKKVLR